MKNHIVPHTSFGFVIAAVASLVTWVALTGWPLMLSSVQAHAQTAARANIGLQKIDLFKTTMDDAMGRVITVRRTERDPGNGSNPHLHAGSHTLGCVIESTYEVKVDGGPLRELGSCEVFYEPLNALHAVSRNASSTVSQIFGDTSVRS